MFARPRPARPAISLWLVFAVNGAVLASWAPRIPAVVESIGLSDRQLGAALFGVAAGSIPALLLTGWILRRVRAAPMCLVSGIAFAMSLPLIALATDSVTLTASLAVAGAASGALDVAMNTAAVQHEQRSGHRVLSRLHGGYSAGVLAGSGSGALAAATAVPVSTHFTIAGVVLLLVLLGAVRGIPRPEPAPTLVGPRRVVRVPVLLLIVAVAALFVEGMVTDWSALLVSRDFAGGTALGGFAVTAFTLAMAFSRTIGDRAAATFGVSAVMFGGGALAGTALAVGGAQTYSGVFIAALALAGLGLGPLFPLLIRSAGAVTGDVGRATATVSAIGYLAYLAGPPLVGLAAGRWGLPLTITYAGLIAAAVISISVLSLPRNRMSRRSRGRTPCSTPAKRGSASVRSRYHLGPPQT